MKRGQGDSLSVHKEETQHPARLRELGLFSLKGKLGLGLMAILYYLTRMLQRRSQRYTAKMIRDSYQIQ